MKLENMFILNKLYRLNPIEFISPNYGGGKLNLDFINSEFSNLKNHYINNLEVIRWFLRNLNWKRTSKYGRIWIFWRRRNWKFLSFPI
jgi:hypothetical protein